MTASAIAAEMIADAGKGGALLDLLDAMLEARTWRERSALIRLIAAVLVA